MRRLWGLLLVAGMTCAGLVALAPAGVGAGFASNGSSDVYGAFVSTAPYRLLDTRSGTGAAGAGPVAAGDAEHLQVDGVGPIPATGVSAVVLNVTVVGPTAPGHLTVYPSGTTPPGTSNLNFVKGETVPNLVIAPVGTYGSLDLLNSSTGSTNLIADVTGYYLDGKTTVPGSFAATTPTRLLDTRNGTGAVRGPVSANHALRLQVAGAGPVPGSDVAAVVLNVTVVGPTAAGHITVYPDGSAPPGTSNLNFVKGETVPNLVVAPIGASGAVDLFNSSSGSTNLVADVFGFLVGGTPSAVGAYASATATRLLDTRVGTGAPAAPVAANHTVRLRVDGVGSIPSSEISAVVLNVTVVGPAAAGHITVYPDGSAPPDTSNLNFVQGQTVPNLVLAPVGADGAVDLLNSSSGSTNLLADVTGYYLAGGVTGTRPPSLTNADHPTTGSLTSVSCGGGTCFAVGSYNGGGPQGLIESLNGTASTALEAPVPGNADSAPDAALNSVSCGSDGGCVAVGHYLANNDSAEFALIETFSNGRWSSIEAPLPSGAATTNQTAILTSVSCTLSTSCVAVGTYIIDGATTRGLLEVETNGRWTATGALTSPGDPYVVKQVMVDAVSCGASGACVAIGESFDAALDFKPLFFTLSDGAWTAVAAPLPADSASPTAYLNAITCTSATNCLAVGSYNNSAGNQVPMATTLASNAWSTVPLPLPSDAATGLNSHASAGSVSCASVGACEVLAGYADSNSVTEPLIETLSGVDWTYTRPTPAADLAPAGPDTNDTLEAITCPAAAPCLAAGAVDYSVNTGLGQAWIETPAAGWSPEDAPVPPDANPEPNANLDAVACQSATVCYAVGEYTPLQTDINPQSSQWTDALVLTIER